MELNFRIYRVNQRTVSVCLGASLKEVASLSNWNGRWSMVLHPEGMTGGSKRTVVRDSETGKVKSFSRIIHRHEEIYSEVVQAYGAVLPEINLGAIR